jgi:hypothetical protein
MWDITKVDFDKQETEIHFVEKYFIIAHDATINSIQIVEKDDYKLDKFIVTAGNDNNIYLHRLSNGAKIGQFGQKDPWNIHDLSNITARPRYVREWKLRLKQLKNDIKLALNPEI